MFKMISLKFSFLKYTILLFAFISANANAQQYQLIIDQNASPYEGSTIFISTYNFYKYLDDCYVPSSAGKTAFKYDLARFLHLSANYVVTSYFTVFQHEVFGHGYRAREFGFSYIGYQINIASGWTSFSLANYNNLNIYQQNALNAAGMEANTILAQQIRQPWFANQKIDNRDAFFYIMNQIGQMRYVYRTSNTNIQDGNDINNYIRGVNRYYGNTSTLSNPKMRAYILADLLDPALYYSFYGLWEYLVTGRPQVDLYMFDVNGYKYLPAIRTILAPYGIEYQLQNFILNSDQQLYQINLRLGSNSSINTAGIDFNLTPFWRYKKLDFANNFSIWYQPKYTYANAAVSHSRIGFAEFVRVKYNFNKCVAAITDLGYKTSGFMQGYQLGNCVIWRFGMQW